MGEGQLGLLINLALILTKEKNTCWHHNASIDAFTKFFE